jgi:hypothetical protein
MRFIEAILFPDIEPGSVCVEAPDVRWVDPTTLLIEEQYQRNVGDRSRKLIRGMVGAWDWRKFKMPNVVEIPAGLAVVDGQCTSIGAASNPLIDLIPVLVTTAPDMQTRAGAFVGLNRDRVNLTATQLHFADVAAGNEDALTIERVCQRAAVRVLRSQSPNWSPGDTIAVQAIGSLINRRHAKGAREVLQVLSEGCCAPITSGQIKAVEALLFDPEFKGKIEPTHISATFRQHGETMARDAGAFATTHGVRVWRALAATIYRKARGRG